MIVDGKQIANQVLLEVVRGIEGGGGGVGGAAASLPPRLTILMSEPDAATKQFVGLKLQKAALVGAVCSVQDLAPQTDVFLAAITAAAETSDGIIVQLPLPPAVDTDTVLAAIPASHDVDVLGEQSVSKDVLAPVAGAVKEILERHDIATAGKQAVVVGNGRLVGQPVADWLKAAGAEVVVIEKPVADLGSVTKIADIIVLGAGVPGLLHPDMIKDNVVILDAGASEDGGVVKGDADPACAKKAALFTSVPGGIGPITVAILLQNLVRLQEYAQS